MALPARSVTTFTTLGSAISRGSSIRFFSVPSTISGSCTSGQDGGVDRGRIDQRLVALDVDDHLGVFGGGHFGHAVGAGEVVGARHPHARAETPCGFVDPLVVGGNDRACQVARLGGPFVDVLEHGFGGDGGQDFAGKTGGGKPRGNHAQDFTRHTRSYHKTPMLDLGKKGWPAVMLPSRRKLFAVQRHLSGLRALLAALRTGQPPVAIVPRPKTVPRSARFFPRPTSAWTATWC